MLYIQPCVCVYSRIYLSKQTVLEYCFHLRLIICRFCFSVVFHDIKSLLWNFYYYLLYLPYFSICKYVFVKHFYSRFPLESVCLPIKKLHKNTQYSTHSKKLVKILTGNRCRKGE